MSSLPLISTVPHSRWPRLTPFLFLSVVLHGALLVWVPQRPSPGDTPALRLALTRPASTEKTATSPPRATPPQPAPEAAPVATPLPAPPIPAAGRAAAAPSAPPAPAEPAQNEDANNDFHAATVLTQVRAALTRHFTYPGLAQRRGWQGEVLLAFSVSREGRIDHVRVVRSSGHRLLDEAARSSLARVEKLHDYTPREPQQLQIPVVYRLIKS